MTTSHPVGDVSAVFLVLISYLTYLPVVLSSLASFGALVWYCIRIYEYIKEKKVSDE